MEEHRLAPLGEEDQQILVGATDPPASRTLRALQAFHCRQVTWRPVPESTVTKALQRRRGGIGIEPSGVSRRSTDGAGVRLTDAPDGEPAVNVLNTLLTEALEARASDVHIRSEGGAHSVRLRIDGTLQDAVALPESITSSLPRRIKAVAGMNVAERRVPQDGSFQVTLGERHYDIRVAVIPVATGEAIVLRLLPRDERPLALAELGMPPVVERTVRRVTAGSAGMVVIAGPTGSGKTTTLHALLRPLAGGPRKIVTLEDPVEYHLAGVDQIQINEATGLTFPSLLRRVLRHDPDIIMVGEVRDSETARLATRAVTTGHLVLTTVHSRRTAEVAARLEELGVGPAVLARIAPVIVSQRLVRRRCICRDSARGERDGGGCPACGHTGYRGRTGIFEATDRGRTVTTFQSQSELLIAAGVTDRQEVSWALSV